MKNRYIGDSRLTFENMTVQDIKQVTFRDCTNITISNCNFKMSSIAFHNCKRIIIENCTFEGTQRTSMISTGRNQKTTDISIRGCRLIGPKIPWEAEDDKPAVGDMINLRNVITFNIQHNTLVGGGEYGIVTGHGTGNGIIAHNSLSDIDGCPLFIGVRETDPVSDIIIVDNTIDGYDGSVLNQSGIFVREATGIILAKNDIRTTKHMPWSYTVRDSKGVSLTKEPLDKVRTINSSILTYEPKTQETTKETTV